MFWTVRSWCPLTPVWSCRRSQGLRKVSRLPKRKNRSASLKALAVRPKDCQSAADGTGRSIRGKSALRRGRQGRPRRMTAIRPINEAYQAFTNGIAMLSGSRRRRATARLRNRSARASSAAQPTIVRNSRHRDLMSDAVAMTLFGPICWGTASDLGRKAGEGLKLQQCGRSGALARQTGLTLMLSRQGYSDHLLQKCHCPAQNCSWDGFFSDCGSRATFNLIGHGTLASGTYGDRPDRRILGGCDVFHRELDCALGCAICAAS
jgi:hypothetical protein